MKQSGKCNGQTVQSQKETSVMFLSILESKLNNTQPYGIQGLLNRPSSLFWCSFWPQHSHIGLSVLSCCHVIGWVAVDVHNQWDLWPNKMASERENRVTYRVIIFTHLFEIHASVNHTGKRVCSGEHSETCAGPSAQRRGFVWRA